MMLPKNNTGIKASKSGVYGGFGDYQGIDVYIKPNGEFSLFWYAPEGRYYVAHCMPGMKDFVLYTTFGGTFEYPSSRAEVVAGEGSLDLDEGVFYYMTEEHGRGSIGITQKYLADGGIYFQPDKVGSGFSIKRFELSTSCYWYTYVDGRQQWFLCSGKPDDMTIYRFADCRINYPGGEVVPCGSAKLNWETMIFDYSIKAFGIDDKGQQVLTKAF